MRRLGYVLMFLFGFGVAACAGRQYVPQAGEIRSVAFDPDAPNFEMEAVANVRDGRTGIDIYVSVPAASLVFVDAGSTFVAGYQILVSVQIDGARLIEEVWSASVERASYAATQRYQSIMRRMRLDVPPGVYTIETVLDDVESGARATRSQDLTIVDPETDETSLSEILLEAARDGGSFEPVVSLHLPAGYDSLRAAAELYSVPETVDLQFMLVRFATDTTTATPPYWFTPASFSLASIGVDYRAVDTLQLTRRRAVDASDPFTIEFDMPSVTPGTYAAVVELTGAETTTRRRRYFTVKSPTFPRITSLVEMVHALRYIARNDEMADLLGAGSLDEMKRRFDAFWADRVPDERAAATLLELYYSRVEQANLLYSTHKPGWKTDRGMLYVVFGPPAYVEELGVRRAWYYFERGTLLNRRLPPFVFRRSMVYGFSGLFDVFVLQRSQGYEGDWRRKVQDWRRGNAL